MSFLNDIVSVRLSQVRSPAARGRVPPTAARPRWYAHRGGIALKRGVVERLDILRILHVIAVYSTHSRALIWSPAQQSAVLGSVIFVLIYFKVLVLVLVLPTTKEYQTC